MHMYRNHNNENQKGIKDYKTVKYIVWNLKTASFIGTSEVD